MCSETAIDDDDEKELRLTKRNIEIILQLGLLRKFRFPVASFVCVVMHNYVMLLHSYIT